MGEATEATTQKTIYIIEDDIEFRDVFQKYLKDKGYQVEVTDSHEDAVERIEGGLSPDIIFSDFDTEGRMDGGDFVAKRYGDDFPIIGISSAGHFNNTMREFGALSTIRKGGLRVMLEKRYPDRKLSMFGVDMSELIEELRLSDQESIADQIAERLNKQMDEAFQPRAPLKKPSNTEPVKHVIIIDDDRAKAVQLDLEESELFPDAEIHAYESVEQALADLRTRDVNATLPDLVVADCTQVNENWGVQNVEALLAYYKDEARTEKLPNILFTSLDESRALLSASYIRNRYRIDAYGANIGAGTDIFTDPLGASDSRSRWDKTGVNGLLNRLAGKKLFPETREEVQQTLVKTGEARPKDVVQMIKTGFISRDEGLPQLVEPISKEAPGIYEKRVDTYSQKAKDLNLDDTKITFEASVGDPTHGYVAYTLDQVDQLAAEGKKAIFVMNEYSPDFIPHLKNISGVIMLGDEGTGHLAGLLQSHQVSGLLGLKKAHYDGKTFKTEQEYESDVFRDGSNHKLSFEEEIQVVRDLEKDSSPYSPNMRLRQRVDELLGMAPREQDKIYELDESDPTYIAYQERYNKARKEARFLTTPIPFGTAMTLQPSQYQGTMYAVHLPIEEKEETSRVEWIHKTADMLREWRTENEIYKPSFKANLDKADQIERAKELGAQGIGLIRTEHIVLSDAGAQAAFKAGLLGGDSAKFDVLRDQLKTEMSKMYEHLADDFPIKVRLVDMPPSECFSMDELADYAAKYGDNTRGVQLAAQVPALYEAQLNGIFEALAASNAAAPAEIMVPTIRTPDELRMVKEMAERIAVEHGVDGSRYRFGSMIETLDACENIEAIVNECDFISIGSNDLTSEVLECGRDDFAKRRELTKASGMGEDPFIVMNAHVISKIEEVVMRARAAKPDIEVDSDIQIDLCGEHGADLKTLMRIAPLELSAVSVRPTPQNLKVLPILYDNALFERDLKAKKAAAEAVDADTPAEGEEQDGQFAARVQPKSLAPDGDHIKDRTGRSLEPDE